MRIDSVDPLNTTPCSAPTGARARSTVRVPVAADATSPSHAEWRVDGGSWTLSGTATVSGTGAHTLDTAAVDSAGNREEVSFTVNIDDVLPTDTTDTAPVGWQHAAVDLTVNGTDAESGVDHIEYQLDSSLPVSVPDGTIVSINTQGQHVFRTRVVDEVGNVSSWAPRTCGSTSPARSTRRTPRRLVHDPRPSTNVVGTDNLGRNTPASSGASTGSPPATCPTRQQPVPVTITGDGVHQLEVRDHRHRQPRPGLAHAPDQDRHGHPDRPDRRRVRLAPAVLAERQRARHGHATPTSSASSGASTAATSARRPRPHDVSVSGDGVHTLETRMVDNAGLPAPGSRARSSSTRPPRPPHPGRPTGWRNTSYAVVLDGADALSGVAASAGRSSSRPGGGRRERRLAPAMRPRRSTRTARIC